MKRETSYHQAIADTCRTPADSQARSAASHPQRGVFRPPSSTTSSPRFEHCPYLHKDNAPRQHMLPGWRLAAPAEVYPLVDCAAAANTGIVVG